MSNVNKLCNYSVYDNGGNWYCCLGKTCICEHNTATHVLWSNGSLSDKAEPIKREAELVAAGHLESEE